MMRKLVSVSLALLLVFGPLASLSFARGHRLRKIAKGAGHITAAVVPGHRCCRK